MNETLPAQIVREEETQISIFNRGPEKLVEGATRIANVLSDIVERKQLYATVQGKKHVLVEGWTTMGAMLGIAAVERCTTELPDGSYEAVVDLKRMTDGMIVGSGSALCSVEEKRWSKAEKNARRSMAITRATSKAFRLGYSWIMVMSGFESCPAEELDEAYVGSPIQKRRLFDAMKAAGITDEQIMKDVHESCLHKARAEVNAVIDEAAELQKSLKGV